MGSIKKMSWGVLIGVFLLITTLLIFFVPNIGREKLDGEYVKLACLIVPEIILILNSIYLSKKRNPLISLGMRISVIIYFILSVILVVMLTEVNYILIVSGALLVLLGFVILLIKNTSKTIEKVTKREEVVDPLK